ncbi:MAG: hypothetical protein LBL62_05800 [Planctomycetaceae bacterium]|nr:hypothetical protein [Planctomycetaceae bacterium]
MLFSIKDLRVKLPTSYSYPIGFTGLNVSGQHYVKAIILTGILHQFKRPQPS